MISSSSVFMHRSMNGTRVEIVLYSNTTTILTLTMTNISISISFSLYIHVSLSYSRYLYLPLISSVNPCNCSELIEWEDKELIPV